MFVLETLPYKVKTQHVLFRLHTTTFFYLGKFLKKLVDQCSSITKDSIYHIKHMSIQPFTMGVNWPEIVYLMEVSIMFRYFHILFFYFVRQNKLDCCQTEDTCKWQMSWQDRCGCLMDRPSTSKVNNCNSYWFCLQLKSLSGPLKCFVFREASVLIFLALSERLNSI